jgi:translation elongation factor EF-G
VCVARASPQLPIGYESAFAGVVDLVRMESIVWDNEDLGATFTIGPIPDDLKEKAAEYHAVLVEQVRAAARMWSPCVRVGAVSRALCLQCGAMAGLRLSPV